MPLGTALLGVVLATVAATGASAVSVARPGAPAPGRWAWPLDPRPAVVRSFDPPDQPWDRGHRGVDLAASVGQPVRSPSSGRVTYAGLLAGREVVVVAHPSGVRSTFEPVAASGPVGSVVARGERVGVVSATAGHCAPQTCVHWGVRRGDTYLDPLAFVGRARVILLPLP